MPTKALTREEQDARVRAAFVEAVCDRHLEQRHRKNAAVNLIRSFPALTKTLSKTLDLIPRPVSAATFDAACDAWDEIRRKPQKEAK